MSKTLIFALLVLSACSIRTEKTYFPSGDVREVFEVWKGKKHGEYEAYYLNGKIQAKGRFKDGRKVGIFKYWSYDNDTLEIFNFQNGVAEGVYRKKIKDKLIIDGVLKSGLQDGLFVSYDGFGDTLMTQWYQNGIPNGGFEIREKNGNKIKGFYDAGKLIFSVNLDSVGNFENIVLKQKLEYVGDQCVKFEIREGLRTFLIKTFKKVRYTMMVSETFSQKETKVFTSEVDALPFEYCGSAGGQLSIRVSTVLNDSISINHDETVP